MKAYYVGSSDGAESMAYLDQERWVSAKVMPLFVPPTWANCTSSGDIKSTIVLFVPCIGKWFNRKNPFHS